MRAALAAVARGGRLARTARGVRAAGGGPPLTRAQPSYAQLARGDYAVVWGEGGRGGGRENEKDSDLTALSSSSLPSLPPQLEDGDVAALEALLEPRRVLTGEADTAAYSTGAPTLRRGREARQATVR